MSSVETNPSAVRQWTDCAGCGLKLPLRLSAHGEQAGLWVCSQCERPFVGVFVHDASRQAAHKVRLADSHFDASDSPPLTQELKEVAIEIAQCETAVSDEKELRTERRTLYGVEAVVAELDTLYCPTGRQHNVFVHNLSPSGLGFVGVQEVDSSRLAIQMSRDAVRLQMIAEISHQSQTPEELFHVGVRFLMRLGNG